jgi:hypothetical protein
MIDGLGKTLNAALLANGECRERDARRCPAGAVGFDGLLGKPIEPQRLPKQIERILVDEMVWEPHEKGGSSESCRRRGAARRPA